jgi:transmembrane sensor
LSDVGLVSTRSLFSTGDPMVQQDRPNEAARAEAIDWWVRRDADPPSTAEAQDFAAWLARDPANEAAYDEIGSLWGDLAHVPRPTPAPQRRAAIPLSPVFAAMLLAVLGFGFEELSRAFRADHRTGTGETRLVLLDDGTRVQLDTDSAIAVDFSAAARQVRLLAGEAWFDVAKDPARPFLVAPGGGTVTALGTSFDVATDPTKTEVTVTAHRVAVVANGARETLAAGEQARFGPGLALEPPRMVDVEAATAWPRGKLIFEEKPLGQIIFVTA